MANAMLAPLSLELKRKESVPDRAEGFPRYVAEAEMKRMDVNDWIEQELGWGAALPILEATLFPVLRADSIVCELGVGTGRWSRRIVDRLQSGELHLVDHSPWIVNFTNRYFRSNPRVHTHLCDGRSLPFSQDAWLDLVFSDGTFIELKLGQCYLYFQEFHRVLKAGAHCVFDYVDPTTPEGWQFLQEQAAESSDCFTYHSAGDMDRLLSSTGLQVVDRQQIGKSTYVTARKPTS